MYQHPLAYLLGVEGVALLRGWAGEFDKEFVGARLDEIRRLLANDSLVNHPGVAVARNDAVTGYRQWSATYDDVCTRGFGADRARSTWRTWPSGDVPP